LLGRALDGPDDSLVSAASAQVLFHVLNDVRFGQIGLFQQQTVCGKYHAGSAVAALKGIMFDESFLEGMKAPILCQAFDGQHFFALNISHGNFARSNSFLIQEYGAGPASAYSTAGFRPGKSQVGPQHPQKRTLFVYHQPNLLIVEFELDCIHYFGPLLDSLHGSLMMVL
jgi:hypothetical protein